jgi:hypothetical protein
MTILFEVGIACGASDFTERAIEVAEEGARHNPDFAPLTGLALNMRGLFNRDSAMVAESVKVLQHSPRRVLRAIGAEGYGGNRAELHSIRHSALRHYCMKAGNCGRPRRHRAINARVRRAKTVVAFNAVMLHSMQRGRWG